jgi:hypothetical protein
MTDGVEASEVRTTQRVKSCRWLCWEVSQKSTFVWDSGLCDVMNTKKISGFVRDFSLREFGGSRGLQGLPGHVHRNQCILALRLKHFDKLNYYMRFGLLLNGWYFVSGYC